MGVKEKRRDPYWQIVRGICILAVIMIHCPNGLSYSIAEQNAWLIIRGIINFPVALFVFMAGYFVNTDKVKQNSCTYLLDRGGRLLIPYLVWTSLYLIKDFILGVETNSEYIGYCFLTGKVAAPFYYIVLLIQLTLLTPIYFIGFYAYNISTGEFMDSHGVYFLTWIFFYILGMDCRDGKWNSVIQKVKWWWIAIALTISLIESFVLLIVGAPVAASASQARYGNFLYATIIALVLIKIRGESVSEAINSDWRRIRKILEAVGDYSYGIFYVHMLAVQVISKIISTVQLSDYWVINFLVCFVASATISYGSVWIVRNSVKKLKIKWILKIIGF